MAVLTCLSAIFGCFRRVAQHVELAHLVRHLRPQFLDCQQFTAPRASLIVPNTFTFNASTGASSAFITTGAFDVTFSAASTRPVSASRTT